MKPIKLTMRTLAILLTVLAACVSVCFLILLHALSGDPRVVLSGLVLCGVLCALLIIAFVLAQKKVSDFSQDLCYTIDKMLDAAEEPLRQTESETLLSRVLHKLNQMYDILQERQRDIGEQKQALQEIVTDISHQSQTPVANLKMVVATLADPSLPEQKKGELIAAMDGQLDKLKFLMESMGKMARLEVGIFTVTKNESSIYETIADAVGPLFLTAEKKHMHIAVDCDEHLTLRHDKRWTAEALFNILENAVKYTGKGGHISIHVAPQEMYTRISVSDDGMGIPEKYHAKIFRRFFRAQDVQHIQGLGVGLYLTRRIITLQDGYMMVESTPGTGSTFHVYLPNN